MPITSRHVALLVGAAAGIASLAAGAGIQVRAQAPAAPTFEVASVKRNLSDRVGGTVQVPPRGAVRFFNVPIRMLIRAAYQLDPYIERYTLIAGRHSRLVGRVDGGPETDVPRFDVQATPRDGTPPRERRAMMRTLLEDRFGLRVHRETRVMPVYALNHAVADRFGPSLAPSTFDCRAFLEERRAGVAAVEPLDAKGDSWCRFPIDNSRPGVTHVRMAGPLRLLVERVQPYLDRPVVDETGLTRNVEWTLTFASGSGDAGDAPQLVTALREQLGLALQTRRAPIAVLVVDEVALPTPD